MGRKNPLQWYSLGPDCLGSSSVEKDLETWADMSAGHERVNSIPWQQRWLTVSCALVTKVQSADRGKRSAPSTPNSNHVEILCPQERHWFCLVIHSPPLAHSSCLSRSHWVAALPLTVLSSFPNSVSSVNFMTLHSHWLLQVINKVVEHDWSQYRSLVTSE